MPYGQPLTDSREHYQYGGFQRVAKDRVVPPLGQRVRLDVEVRADGNGSWISQGNKLEIVICVGHKISSMRNAGTADWCAVHPEFPFSTKQRKKRYSLQTGIKFYFELCYQALFRVCFVLHVWRKSNIKARKR